MEFVVHRADSSWSAVMLAPVADTAQKEASPARVERVACPSADSGAIKG
jgi:hypothetical protein